MKKIFASVLCLLLLLTLAGCTNGNDPTTIDAELEALLAVTAKSHGAVEVTSEKTALNYLTGEYNMAQDRVGQRPYAISVNNIKDCWPQYGTSQSDIIIEIETEGGITRLMCLFADTRELDLIGSVRSLRDQFLEAIYPLDPIIVHIGTSIYAERALMENSINTLDGDIVPISVYILQERVGSYALEHTKFTSGQNIAEGIRVANISTASSMTIDSYFTFVGPDDDPYVPEGGSASRVTFQYSSNTDYDGEFVYDAATGQYLKFQRGQAQMDAGANVQLGFDNVLVLQANIKVIEGSALVNVDYQAGGTGYYFCNGEYVEIHWIKGDYNDTFEFTLADGTPLTINPGNTMISFMRSSLADTLVIEP